MCFEQKSYSVAQLRSTWKKMDSVILHILLIWFTAGMRHAIREVSLPTKGSADCAKCTST